MKEETLTLANCGCVLILFVTNLVLGGWSVNLLLDVFLHKMLPFGWAVVIGLFTGEFTVPVAIIVAILRHFGIV